MNGPPAVVVNVPTPVKVPVPPVAETTTGVVPPRQRILFPVIEEVIALGWLIEMEVVELQFTSLSVMV